jgi:hypothetical protein
LRAVDRIVGEVQGVGCFGFGPVRVLGGGLSVQLSGPPVDLGLNVVHLGRGVGPHLRELAACTVGGLVDPLLCPLLGVLSVLLGLVDSLPELLTRLGGGSLHRRPCRRDPLPELIDSSGKLHDSSFYCGRLPLAQAR